jgi:hypothetical protein
MSLLRSLFGPSREEVWSALAAEIGARYEDRGFWGGGGRVRAAAGEWTITLDCYVVSNGKQSTTYTRLRAPYVNPSGLRFTIRRAHFLDGLGAILGLQDVEIGHPSFDGAFVVKANDEAAVKRLLRVPGVREAFRSQPRVHLSVKDDEGWFGQEFPEGVDVLQFVEAGVVTDPVRLRSLFDLFATVLHGLCHVGAAYEDDPELDLK